MELSGIQVVVLSAVLLAYWLCGVAYAATTSEHARYRSNAPLIPAICAAFMGFFGMLMTIAEFIGKLVYGN